MESTTSDATIVRALQDRLAAEQRLALLRAELGLEELRLAMITAWVLAQAPRVHDR